MANTKIISPSALDRFFRCPLAFRLQEFAPRQVDTVPQMLGKERHGVLEKFFKDEELTSEEVSQIESLLTEDFITDLGLFENSEEVGVEETFAIDKKSYAIHGIKDLRNKVGDRVLVIDWKTGKSFYRTSDVESSLQGKIYAYDEFLKDNKVEMVFFRIAMTEYQRVVGVTYYRDDLEQLDAEIRQAINYYISCHNHKEYPARPSSLGCGRCDFIAKCPHNILTQELEILDNVDTDQKFSDAIKQMTVTKEYLAQLESFTNEYAKARVTEGTGSIKDINVHIEEKTRETVSRSKKSNEILEKYANKLGYKLNTGIKDLRNLGDEEYAKLKELGVIKSSVTEKFKFDIGITDE
jgi:CRISPR/Cas system-associated exonuclease Cas4 (RecB family)